MPDPVELLSLIAELSIGLAGFSGVVVAFAGSGATLGETMIGSASCI